eukprot:gnl/MRDRNA2_/MRDRNA2_69678_c0_seq2.p1 gnl/MRDRNA2_/MRDRNA2_69678_c0~~gnl/MRDRNA2_/MRDRNA2_69678_c0_seq2.p1  ORF type:complete len:239 (+),score=30.87 gnl/MRDRNA2_/MRDRNA2_69678_c0_seq2:33-749(+)
MEYITWLLAVFHVLVCSANLSDISIGEALHQQRFELKGSFKHEAMHPFLKKKAHRIPDAAVQEELKRRFESQNTQSAAFGSSTLGLLESEGSASRVEASITVRGVLAYFRNNLHNIIQMLIWISGVLGLIHVWRCRDVEKKHTDWRSSTVAALVLMLVVFSSLWIHRQFPANSLQSVPASETGKNAESLFGALPRSLQEAIADLPDIGNGTHAPGHIKCEKELISDVHTTVHTNKSCE